MGLPCLIAISDILCHSCPCMQAGTVAEQCDTAGVDVAQPARRSRWFRRRDIYAEAAPPSLRQRCDLAATAASVEEMFSRD